MWYLNALIDDACLTSVAKLFHAILHPWTKKSLLSISRSFQRQPYASTCISETAYDVSSIFHKNFAFWEQYHLRFRLDFVAGWSSRILTQYSYASHGGQENWIYCFMSPCSLFPVPLFGFPFFILLIDIFSLITRCFCTVLPFWYPLWLFYLIWLLCIYAWFYTLMVDLAIDLKR